MTETERARADHRLDSATEAFVAHRSLLFTVAYEMLGSAADAEDVLQETWVRWAGVDLATVQDQRAYLIRIASRQALNRLRTLRRRKESYVGPWLPEPLLTAPDVADDVELAESVSIAMLLVLETLAPTERAVFVLRDVFDLGYDEIAQAVEIETGDLQSLLDLLAPDVVLLTDGGGVVQAALAPVVGAGSVARLTAKLGRFGSAGTLRETRVNGRPALAFWLDGEIDSVIAARIDDGLISGLYAVRNPEKLAGFDRETAVGR